MEECVNDMSKGAHILPRVDKRTGYFYDSVLWTEVNNGEGQSGNTSGGFALDTDDNEYEESELESLNIGRDGIVTSILQDIYGVYVTTIGNFNFNINGFLGAINLPTPVAWVQANDAALTKTQADLDAAYVRYQAGAIAEKGSNSFYEAHAKCTFTPGYVQIIRPNDDKTTQWNRQPASGTHASKIDSDVVQPAAGNITTWIAAGAGQSAGVDEIYFSSILGVSNVSAVKVWLYAEEFLGTEGNVVVDVYLGALLGSKNVAWTTDPAWYSYSWTGLTKSQANLDGIYVKFTAPAMSGVDGVFVYTAYIEVTYEPTVVVDRMNNEIGAAPCAFGAECRPQYWKYGSLNGMEKRKGSLNGMHIV